MIDVAIHLGHCYRLTGSTGTAGHRGTEQEFVTRVGSRMVADLSAAGLSAVTVLADAPIPESRVFVALHQDGSDSPAAAGASIGYPTGAKLTESQYLGQLWKASYQKAGWPSGFRPDNYTMNLRRYYGFRRSSAPVQLLIEHGFATNRRDADWMWDNVDLVAVVDASAVMRYLGVSSPADEDDGMETLIDTDTGEHWVAANGRARPLSKPDEWMAGWVGPVRKSPNMAFVVSDLYDIVG